MSSGCGRVGWACANTERALMGGSKRWMRQSEPWTTHRRTSWRSGGAARLARSRAPAARPALLCRHPCRQKARSEPPSLPADETEGERGCTIYEQRPSACRNFDCRAFSAMGLVEHCDRNHRTPDWSLRPRASPALATGCRALRRLPFTRRPLPDPSRAE